VSTGAFMSIDFLTTVNIVTFSREDLKLYSIFNPIFDL